MSRLPDDAGKQLPAALAGGLTAGASAIDPVLGVAVAMLEPAAEQGLCHALAAIGLSGRRSVAVMLQDAAAKSGTSPAQLVDVLQRDENRQRLLARAVRAAMFAAYPDRLRALGACLAASIPDSAAVVDQELLLVAALEDLEQAHYALLQTVERLFVADEREREGLSLGGIAAGMPSSSLEGPDAVAALLGVPIAHGLVTAHGGFGGTWYRLSPLGALLLTRAREVHSGGRTQ